MKRTVEISAGVGHHLDLRDIKLSARRVMRARLFATEKVADDWRREAFVGDQAFGDCVTEMGKLFGGHYEKHYSAANGHAAQVRSVPGAVATGLGPTPMRKIARPKAFDE